MAVWTDIINLCALIVYSLGIFSIIIIPNAVEYLVTGASLNNENIH